MYIFRGMIHPQNEYLYFNYSCCFNVEFVKLCFSYMPVVNEDSKMELIFEELNLKESAFSNS